MIRLPISKILHSFTWSWKLFILFSNQNVFYFDKVKFGKTESSYALIRHMQCFMYIIESGKATMTIGTYLYTSELQGLLYPCKSCTTPCRFYYVSIYVKERMLTPDSSQSISSHSREDLGYFNTRNKITILYLHYYTYISLLNL